MIWNAKTAPFIARRAHSRRHSGYPLPYRAAVVTCDIVGHSTTRQYDTMKQRLRGINEVVGHLLDNHPRDSVLWASGGDGGHVLFLNDDWQASVLDLMRDLRAWADRDTVPLRIAAHYGQLDVIAGADGRLQPVGEAINTAAWILTRTSSVGVVVSSQFRAAAGALPDVEFHDRRPLRSKHGRPQTAYLLSLVGSDRRSEWSDPVAEDQERLRAAVERGNGLEAIYWAKRLMLVNSADRGAMSALAGVSPLHFRYNPILGQIGPATLHQLIGAGKLIELGYGDVLCRRGDTGNTMFVILRGLIGVYGPDLGHRKSATPLATHREGDIVGELAFALHRERTADLVSLGNTALLSLDYEQLSTLLDRQSEMIWEFMTRRALEHVSQHVPYLVGAPLGTLPQRAQHEWQEALSILGSSCHIITREPHRRVTLADIRRLDRRRTAAGGIYILASGHLQSLSTDGKELDGGRFPLLYVDLPDLLVAPDHEYTVEQGPAKIIFIGQEAIDQLPPPMHTRLVRELKREVHDLYHYDAFISYNLADEPVAKRWAAELTRQGLRVFRDSRVRPGGPHAEKNVQALLDSLTVLVLVSPHAIVNDVERSFLLKEVRFRERHFERPRIIPVQLPEGDPQLLDIMYSAIRAEGREPDAIAEAAALIRAIRHGEEEAPYGLRRRSGRRLQTNGDDDAAKAAIPLPASEGRPEGKAVTTTVATGDGGVTAQAEPSQWPVAWLIRLTAFLLPREERARFIEEQAGSVASSDSQWERITFLTDLLLHAPTTAWVIRRERWLQRPPDLHRPHADNRAGSWDRRPTGRLLAVVAQLLLPAEERFRFIEEQAGSLASSNSRWERITFLADILLHAPKLAWVMRSERRQRPIPEPDPPIDRSIR